MQVQHIMTTDSRVFLALIVSFACWLCFMWGQSTIQCPRGINEIPKAKYQHSEQEHGKPLVCVYQIEVVRTRKRM